MAKTIVTKTLIPIEFCIEVEDSFDENNQKSVNELFRDALIQEFAPDSIVHNSDVLNVFPGTYEEFVKTQG